MNVLKRAEISVNALEQQFISPITTANDIPHDIIIDTLTPPCDKGIGEIDRIRFRGNISQAIRTDCFYKGPATNNSL